MLPLWQAWATAYAQAQPDMHVSVGGTNSGTGFKAVLDHAAAIGASDAYMSDADAQANPGILDIPLAISAQVVAVNLPELHTPVRLSGPVLAGIYAGRIRAWNDSEIAALNRGVTLPARPIVPIRRADPSGDTFVFTQFLTFSAPAWESGPGYGTTIDWPSRTGRTAKGNDGMVEALASTPGGIAYVGASYEAKLAQSNLSISPIENQAGRFVTPTPASVEAASAELTPRTPVDERLTLVFAPGADAYPLINYEYAVVRRRQSDPAQASALRDFLLWTITPGQGTRASIFDPAHFTALPTAIRALSETQISQIQ